MKGIMLLAILLYATGALGQEPVPKLKGVGINLTAKESIYPQFFIRLSPAFEVQGIANYSISTKTINNFDNSTIEGWYIGGGAAMLTRPLRRKVQESSKVVKGSFRFGFKVMGGKMRVQADKFFPSRTFTPYTYRVDERNVSTAYFEVSLSYEMIIADRVMVTLSPLTIGDSSVDRVDSSFTPTHSIIGGRIGQPLNAGIAISYLWR